ncbi:ATP-binding protein, partial [Actinomadura fibrosa]|uniref:ATP-binding protein n=1 Tax=Actinomadura fibrosa TaxID=111802 RepID=UPI001A956085
PPSRSTRQWWVIVDLALMSSSASTLPQFRSPPPEPVPAQLPPDIPDFTGRDAEVAALTAILRGDRAVPGPGAVTVATVAGMGGLGKTTLAVHVAHAIADAFPGGQLYADLRGDSAAPADPAAVLGGFLRALGMSGTGVPPSLDERVALYRSRLAGRRTLVVLDNVASEEQVRPLLPGTPAAAVLITSRNRLVGLEGAHLLNLDVLPSAQAVEMITRIVGARRVGNETAVAAEIARLCGHVPLAVRIAAARLLGRGHWSLSHLAGVLREERSRLDELVAGDLAVRSNVEMSYRQLPPRTRRAFRLIGLLDAPDFAAWAVAALLDAPVPDAQRHLEALIDAHLVGIVGADGTGQLRYRVHDLLRLYARERCESEDPPDERAAALGRALGGWLALAEEAAERVPGPCYAAMHGAAPRWRLPARAVAALLADPTGWFAAEHAALVAGVGQACDLGLTELAWDLAASMERYCDVRGMYDDWRQMHERALDLCRRAGDRRGEAVLLRGLIEVTTWTSPAGPGPAMTRLRGMGAELLDLFTELDDPRGMADALVMMVWARTADGDKSAALALAERALDLAQAAGYLGGQARAHHVMAVVHGEADPHSALGCLERALVVAKEVDNPRFIATIVQFLGAARALSGDLAGGKRLLDDSLAMARELGDRYLETFSLLFLSKLFAATGDERARPTLRRTLAFSRAGNFGHHLADALCVLGELNLAEGDARAAIDCLEQSVEVWRTRGWIPYLARTLRSLGDARAAAGDRPGARAAWEEARDLFAQVSDEAGRSSAEERLSRDAP